MEEADGARSEQEGRAVARAESVEGWLLLRLIQSTATLSVGRRSFRRIPTVWTGIVEQKNKKKKEKRVRGGEKGKRTQSGIRLGDREAPRSCVIINES